MAVVLAGALIAGAIIVSRSGLDESGNLASVTENGQLGQALYVKLAKDLGVKEKDFIACQADPAIEAKVKDNSENAIASSGDGTPFSVVIAPNGKYIGISGARDVDFMKDVITKALAGYYATDMRTNKQGILTEELTGVLKKAEVVDQGEHIRGNTNAPLTIIEYSDFQCPYCAKFHPTMKQLTETFPGQIKWVYRHLPLTNIHSNAVPAAVASECVARLAGNDAFWEFADNLFVAQSQ